MNNPSVEINILPFQVKHFELLKEMLKNQKYLGISHVTMKSLPKTGYIAMLGKEPIAAGFLRKVEGNYAQFDGLVSNPMFGSQIRHMGISFVVSNLIADAKRMKFLGILAFTEDESVIKRALDIGFIESKQRLITLSL